MGLFQLYADDCVFAVQFRRQAFDAPRRRLASCHLTEVHNHPVLSVYEMDFALIRIRQDLVALLKSLLIRVEVYLDVFKAQLLRRRQSNAISHRNSWLTNGVRFTTQDLIDSGVGLIYGAELR